MSADFASDRQPLRIHFGIQGECPERNPAGCEFDGSGESVELVMQKMTEAMEFYLEALMAEERESRLSR